MTPDTWKLVAWFAGVLFAALFTAVTLPLLWETRKANRKRKDIERRGAK